MPDSKQSLSQRWQEYRPSKAIWLWSCVGAVFLTMILGFTAGGWVTGGTAEQRTEVAADDAREQLVASICVERFISAPDAAAKLAALKEESRWEQDNFIRDGGWTNIDALKEQVNQAANVCADKLVAMEGLPKRALDADASATSTADG